MTKRWTTSDHYSLLTKDKADRAAAKSALKRFCSSCGQPKRHGQCAWCEPARGDDDES